MKLRFAWMVLSGSLAVALVACPIEQLVAPTANADSASTLSTVPVQINVSENDVAGSGSLDVASIDLDPVLAGVQLSFNDVGGSFAVNGGSVTFTPKNGVAGKATAQYTIKNTLGLESAATTISVTVTNPVPTTPLKVLFIGNSRTRYNTSSSNMCTDSTNLGYNIPEMFKTVAAGEPRKLDVVAVSGCGKNLLSGTVSAPNATTSNWTKTADAGTARGFIAFGGWTHVVLQPSTDDVNAGTASLISTIKLYDAEIKRYNPNAVTVLYENWWLKGNSVGMATITNTMESVASSVGAKLVPVGRSWQQSGLSESVLFNNDGEGKHATLLGAYVAASAFYNSFYGKAAPVSPIPTGVSGDTAKARTGAKNAFDALGAGFKIQ